MTLGLDRLGFDLDAGPSGGAGGGGSSVPSWVEALRATSGDLPLFAYNFANGGSGQGWDGTNSATLTIGQAWQSIPFATPWDPSNVIDGLGLQQGEGSSAQAEIPIGILPPSAAGGGCILIQAQAYAPVTDNTVAALLFDMTDNPDQNNEGGPEPKWLLADPNIRVDFDKSNGSVAVSDTFAKATILRAVTNYTVDGSDIVGSANGRANVTGAGRVSETLPNTAYVFNHAEAGTDVPVYITLVAVYALQPAGDLPTLSAL